MTFTQQTGSDGAFAYRSERSLLTGRQWARRGWLCQSINGYLPGREMCGLVYRRSASDGGMPFVFVSIDSVKFFATSN